MAAGTVGERQRSNRVDDGLGRVQHLMDPRRGATDPFVGLRGTRQTDHGLERGQGDEHDHGEQHPVEPARAHRVEPEDHSAPDRDPSEEGGECSPHACSPGRRPLDCGQLGVHGRHRRELGRRSAIRDQVRRPLDEVDDRPSEAAAGACQTGLGAPGKALRDGGHEHCGQEEGHAEEHRHPRLQRGCQDDDRRRRDRRDGVGRDHTQQQVLLRVDVTHEPGEQVAAVERGQARRCEAFEALKDPHPQVSEGAKRRVMAHEALAIAEQPPRQSEEAYGDHGDGQRLYRRMLSCPRDQPGRSHEQPDRRSDGRCAKQHSAGEAKALATDQLERPSERNRRRCRPRRHRWADQGRIRHSTTAGSRDVAGSSLMTRSAIAASAGRCATSRTVRP